MFVGRSYLFLSPASFVTGPAGRDGLPGRCKLKNNFVTDGCGQPGVLYQKKKKKPAVRRQLACDYMLIIIEHLTYFLCSLYTAVCHNCNVGTITQNKFKSVHNFLPPFFNNFRMYWFLIPRQGSPLDCHQESCRYTKKYGQYVKPHTTHGMTAVIHTNTDSIINQVPGRDRKAWLTLNSHAHILYQNRHPYRLLLITESSHRGS